MTSLVFAVGRIYGPTLTGTLAGATPKKRSNTVIRVNSVTLRRAILATFLLSVMAFAIVVFAVPSSEAAPSGNCTYYNNAAHTTVVGQFGYDCCNNRVAWGIKTQFSQCGGCFVCFPPPR
jgi:hypothetical protein